MSEVAKCPKCGSTWVYVERLTKEGQVFKCSKCSHEWSEHAQHRGAKDGS